MGRHARNLCYDNAIHLQPNDINNSTFPLWTEIWEEEIESGHYVKQGIESGAAARGYLEYISRACQTPFTKLFYLAKSRTIPSFIPLLCSKSLQ